MAGECHDIDAFRVIHSSHRERAMRRKLRYVRSNKRAVRMGQTRHMANIGYYPRYVGGRAGRHQAHLALMRF